MKVVIPNASSEMCLPTEAYYLLCHLPKLVCLIIGHFIVSSHHLDDLCVSRKKDIEQQS
jgi:hypothetical protein